MIVQALTDRGISCKYEELLQVDHFDIVENFQLENYKLSAVSNKCTVARTDIKKSFTIAILKTAYIEQ